MSLYHAASCVWLAQVTHFQSKPFPILFTISGLSFRSIFPCQSIPSVSPHTSAVGFYEYQRCSASSLISYGVRGKWSFCILAACSADTLASVGLGQQHKITSSSWDTAPESLSWGVECVTSKWVARAQIDYSGRIWLPLPVWVYHYGWVFWWWFEVSGRS